MTYQLEATATAGALLRANTALAIVVSHYDGINLQAVGEGFADGCTLEELEDIETEVSPTASSLFKLVPTEAVLQWVERE